MVYGHRHVFMANGIRVVGLFRPPLSTGRCWCVVSRRKGKRHTRRMAGGDLVDTLAIFILFYQRRSWALLSGTLFVHIAGRFRL